MTASILKRKQRHSKSKNRPRAGKRTARIDAKSLAALQSYSWPGNIRELQNVIERSVIVCDTDEFSVDESWLSVKPAPARPLCDDPVDQEKERIEAVLAETKGRVSGPSGVAARLGMPASDARLQDQIVENRQAPLSVG